MKERPMKAVDLPIVVAHVLMNLVGKATEAAAELATKDPRYSTAKRADLYWRPKEREFVILPRHHRDWKGSWGLKPESGWTKCCDITGNKMRHGLTDREWHRLFARTARVLEIRREFYGEFQRLDFAD